MIARLGVLLGGVGLMLSAGAAVKAVDLTDEAQAKALPRVRGVSLRTDLAKGLFANGDLAFRYRITKAWFGELPRWPSCNLKTAVTDWSGFDRLVLDVYSGTAGGEHLSFFIAPPTGRVQVGLSAGCALRDHGPTRLVIPLKWPTTMSAKNVGRIHVFTSEPIDVDAYIDGFHLLKKGEPLPPVSKEFEEKVVLPYQRREAKLAADRHAAAVNAFVAKCRAAGQDGGIAWFGKATSMEKILPRADYAVAAADAFSLKAARGERESFQVLVLPAKEGLKGVSVAVSDLRTAAGDTLPSAAFKASPVGYVNASNEAPYRVGYNVATNLPGGYARLTRRPVTGWWPDPILDHLNSVDVRKDDLQSFWVRLTCPDGQKAGTYRGEVTVRGEGWAKSFPLTVRIWDFAVPKKSPLPMAITFAPGPHNSGKLGPDAPVKAWKRHEMEWGEFLADYYITMDSLYHRGESVHWEVLKRLEAEGRLGVFNLGYWSYPSKMDEKTLANWREKAQRQFGPAYAKAKELGLLKNAYLYGCDEVKPEFFPNIRYALAELRKMFPGVPLFTTAYDHDFGIGTPLAGMDWFTPLTPRYAEHFAKIAPSRAAGHQVWWYICCGPHAPCANMFVECPAIEGRMLMGAQTVKWRPDGFLYYQVTIWNSERCISGDDAFTDWEPRSWRIYHGDGSWFCCGPDGRPCATVRIENFRDGLEDYAYALEYERRTGKTCEVPVEVTRGIKEFTDDPAVYYAWRDALAESIEKAAAR